MPVFRPHPAFRPHVVAAQAKDLTTAELAALLWRIGDTKGEDRAGDDGGEPAVPAITWPVADDLADALAASLPLDEVAATEVAEDEPPAAMSLEEMVAALTAARLAEDETVVVDPPTPPEPTERELALAALLAAPPTLDDAHALDLLYLCWPRHTAATADSDLLAVANNLARFFGRPGKMPMATALAWRTLDPIAFEADFAALLGAIVGAIDDWQERESEFLILDFGEIDLIEVLFEALHPGRHQDVLAAVMSIKALSNRRQGLLRRMPARLRRAVEPLVEAGQREAALVELAHAEALMHRIAEPLGFAPIIEAAARAAQDLDKLMRQVAGDGAPPPPAPPLAGSLPLGRIGG